MITLTPADPQLFFSKSDPDDPRLGEWPTRSTPPEIDLFGWPDDDGIRLNGGRVGAAQAPDRIRRFLYRMTPSATGANPRPWADRGNLVPTTALTLPVRHAFARHIVSESYQQDRGVLSFGGGHDYGFPDAAGFLDAALATGQRPVVINFDAHLDVRPAHHGFHSGTPFRRLLEEFGGRFDFLEIGLQEQCNSRVHAQWAESQSATLWWNDRAENLLQKAQAFAQAHTGAPCFISLDIDAITSRSAPGCSQSWDNGLESSTVFAMIHFFVQKMNWSGLGIYEVSPPLDQDDRTSKLAAQFAFQFLHHRGRA